MQWTSHNSQGQSEKTDIQLRKALDDEHTPGVFHVSQCPILLF